MRGDSSEGKPNVRNGAATAVGLQLDSNHVQDEWRGTRCCSLLTDTLNSLGLEVEAEGLSEGATLVRSSLLSVCRVARAQKRFVIASALRQADGRRLCLCGIGT